MPPTLEPLMPVEVEQPGQLRADGTIATASLPQSEPIRFDTPFGSSNVATLNQEARRSAENLKTYQDSTGIIDTLTKQGQEASGFKAHALATLAALSGNFGPAIALEEQKRKTKVTSSLTPAMIQANKLANSGDFEGATQFLQTVGANIGDRAPEAAKFLTQAISNLNEKHVSWKNADSYVTFLEGSIPKEDPRQQSIKMMRKLVDTKSYVSQQLLERMGQSLTPHIQVFRNDQGGATATDPNTLQVTQKPLQTFADASQLTGTVVPRLVGATGLGINEIMNSITTGQDVTNPAGKTFTSDQLKEISAGLMKDQGQFEVAAKTPTTPNYVESAAVVLGNKYPTKTPAEITEMVAKGQLTPEERVQTQTLAAQYREREAAAAIIAAQQHDVHAAAKANTDIMYGNSTAGNFGDVINSMSHIDKEKDKDLIYIDKNIRREIVTPAIQAVKDLDKVKNFYSVLSSQNLNGTETFDRLGVGVQRFLENTLGIAFDPSSTVAKAYELVIDRALERVGKTEKIDSVVVKQLKDQILKRGSEPEGSKQAVEVLQKRLNQEIGTYVNQNRTKVEATTTNNVDLLNGASGQGWDKRTAPEAAQIRKTANVIASQAAKEFGVREGFIHRLMEHESGNGIFTTHNKNDGYGPMQILKSTAGDLAKTMGVTVDEIINDSKVNIIAGTLYASQLLKKHKGDEWLAARDYNGSEYKEDYANKVTGVNGPGKAMQAQRQAGEKLAPIIPSAKAAPVLKPNFSKAVQ